MPTQKKTSDVTKSILDIVHSCDAVIMATVRDDGMPDVRHLANALNRTADNLSLMFLTGRTTPKAAQVLHNPKCCLYYYNDETHYVVRLYGVLELVTDAETRAAYWDDDFRRFGYTGPDDAEFVLMRFTPDEYKYYDADGLQSGAIK